MARILIAIVFITVIVSLLSIWFYPSVEDFIATNARWNAINRFSGEFKAEILESLEGISGIPEKTGKKMLIVIPVLEYSEHDLSIIRNFVNDGGTLLLMDDYGYGNTILSFLGLAIRFSGATLLDPVFSYKNQMMPRVIDFIPQLKDSGIEMIMLNHATALVNSGADDVIARSSVARSSGASFLDQNADGVLNGGDIKGPLSVAAEMAFGKGQVVMVADSSIFIDSMVGKDNNSLFMEYLTGRNVENKIILIDGAHLPKSPLDIAKRKLYFAQRALSNPYALIGLLSFIFIAVYRYTLWGGESADR